MTVGRSAVVVAHPDDESLWLSSILASADQVVFCFSDPFERPQLSGRGGKRSRRCPWPALSI
jgi:hypothetical protein